MEAKPAALVVAALYRDPEALSQAERRLETLVGPLERLGDEFAFDCTDYYRAEMGPNLHKRLLLGRRLVERQLLPAIKLATNDIERQLAAESGRRRVNLDPGLLSPENLVLASTKPRGHRVYLGRGIWAEVTMAFQHGRFEMFAWTYPDYRSAELVNSLQRARGRLLQTLRRGDYRLLREVPCSRA